MFGRIFRVALKLGERDEYARAIEQKVIPILHRCDGFRDEIVMISTDGIEGIAISLCERQETHRSLRE